MGSLMAGWDSPVPDPKSVKYKRNWSFTKGEIDAYWKLKKKIEEDHLKAISSPSQGIQDGVYGEDYGINLQRSISLPLARTKEGHIMGVEAEQNLEELIMKKNGWWTRSTWAFLNEPPVLERSSNTYASQFHIANLAVPKANDTGISAK